MTVTRYNGCGFSADAWTGAEAIWADAGPVITPMSNNVINRAIRSSRRKVPLLLR
jgi:hypothetical protein